MPHPEINQVSLQTQTCVTRDSPSWAPGYVSVGYSDEIVTLAGYWEAESSNNPIRTDGSRGPSPHWIKRVAIAAPPQHASTQPKPGATTWFMRDSVPAMRIGELNRSNPRLIVDQVIPPISLGVESQARLNFLAKLAKAKGEAMELGVFTGEFREAVGQLAGIAIGIVTQAKELARAHRVDEKAIKHLLKQASAKRRRPYKMSRFERTKWFGSSTTTLPEDIVDNWLGFQFGLKPLFSDIISIKAHLMAEIVEGGSKLTTTIRSGSEGTVQHEVLLCGTGASQYYNVIGEFDVLERVMFVGSYEIPTDRNIRRETGFENQASVLWNLCCYSWMVDYAFGVGDWFQSLTAANGTNFLEGTVSKVQKSRLIKARYELAGGLGSQNDWQVTPDGPLMIEADYFRREMLSPVGVLPPPLPVMKKQLGLTQLANSLSVLRNFVR